MALVANKSDLITRQEVPEEDGRQFASDIGAIFQITSAMKGVGIKELFYKISEKIINGNNNLDEDQLYKSDTISIKSSDLSKKIQKSKKCCGI